jgi:c-di-GMP-binding flagellar brake protein YcgR
LFWKKKADNKYNVRFESKDKRDYYRLKPSRKEKFFILVNSKAFEISDISAGGAAFFSERLNPGGIYDFELWLSDKKNDFIRGRIEITGFENGLARAKFIDVNENDKERIHKFVFDRQIKSARESKHKNN